MKEPMLTRAEIRRARGVAFALLAAGLIFSLVGTLGERSLAAGPALMCGLAAGLWLRRAEEAHARLQQRQSDPA